MELQKIKMDAEDIDLWYEDEKQQSMDDYLKDIEIGKDRKKSEEKYEKRIQSAIARYNLLMDDKLDRKKKTKLQSILSNIKAKFIIMRK